MRAYPAHTHCLYTGELRVSRDSRQVFLTCAALVLVQALGGWDWGVQTRCQWRQGEARLVTRGSGSR